MKQGHLSQYFVGIACKRLSAVEASRHRSNQHEFDGVNGLRGLLGNEKTRFAATFLYLTDEESEPTFEAGFLTWYDARENHPTRSEWRLYFPDTAVSERASEGDLLVLARRPDNTIMVIVAAAGSTIENQILWLFGLENPNGDGYATQGEADTDGIRLAFAAKILLEYIGVEIDESDDAVLDELVERFDGRFPSTAEFSSFARAVSRGVDPTDDPDGAVLVWLEKEERLFRTLERHIIRERLRAGFSDDVDEFLRYSLSVQNRRKARAGAALENHLAFTFSALGLRFERSVRTEGKSKPDFIFPGANEYGDAAFPASRLTMLGVKSTCKDRWRQVLAEADRIEQKHLLTLEPGISLAQTEEMKARNVQLILPKEIHSSYAAVQKVWLMDIKNFVDFVRSR